MSGLKPSQITAFGDSLHQHLCEAFPEQTWMVIPEYDGNSQEVGFLVATEYTPRDSNLPRSVVTRPRIRIQKFVERSNDLIEGVLSAMEDVITDRCGEEKQFRGSFVHSWILTTVLACPIEHES